MKNSVAALAVLAFGFASAQSATSSARGVQQPSTAPAPSALTAQGCFDRNATTWEKYTPKQGISSGSCNDECKLVQEKNVMALNGEDCYCGDSYPPLAAVVDDKKCNFPCPFYSQEACGGVDGGMFYSVFNTGLKLVVPHDEVASSTSSAASKPTTPTTSAGGAVETVIETPVQSSAPASTDDSKKGGPNTAGIAAGVVVGVVVVAAILGGIYFFIRRRRNAEIEEEHRRNAAVNAFIGGPKPPSSSGMSMSDSRMDPTLAHRRMSDGSIADNQDYSRKILRVTNA
ncbi:transmembrane alpha-helix domain-containing protein [Colletotrichum higginsianum IMI 349063]|uniref:Transmembrane alpha-helix domain-containing protein n=2 Tax=Colletotrichum higginsianum TaxID=80884 RepID=A0A1B7YW96_COLHI|nr:transmembrane alpha-helix domain-containing protein [Colletotrichum higginsianum IMI 349063]OBR16232.1 transmembrane alpha-helix domain-containing protein [Colletotrichum higginsianum IMI 349063]TID04236.1 Cell wall integrity and stress response component 1 [Colletotrichum higginsianum]GJC91518.1 transmembrane alpha-helix domain-containing protein [Colletotrichum higginsianum]